MEFQGCLGMQKEFLMESQHSSLTAVAKYLSMKWTMSSSEIPPNKATHFWLDWIWSLFLNNRESLALVHGLETVKNSLRWAQFLSSLFSSHFLPFFLLFFLYRLYPDNTTDLMRIGKLESFHNCNLYPVHKFGLFLPKDQISLSISPRLANVFMIIVLKSR